MCDHYKRVAKGLTWQMEPPETGLIGGIEKREIKIVDYDPDWPMKFETHTRVIAGWFSLGRFLSGGYEDLFGLVAWATARPDLDIRPGSYGLEGFGVPVGDWSYVSEKIVRDLT
jgi:hypothetical protein